MESRPTKLHATEQSMLNGASWPCTRRIGAPTLPAKLCRVDSVERVGVTAAATATATSRVLFDFLVVEPSHPPLLRFYTSSSDEGIFSFVRRREFCGQGRKSSKVRRAPHADMDSCWWMEEEAAAVKPVIRRFLHGQSLHAGTRDSRSWSWTPPLSISPTGHRRDHAALAR